MRRVRSAPLGRRVAGVALALAAVLSSGALAGCSSSSAAGQVTLAVKDLDLRKPGAECAGSQSLMYLHAGAEFRITDNEQRTLLEGTLPAGTAQPAYDIDLGNAVRIPTVCTMNITLDQVPAGEAAWLVVADEKPIALRGAESAGSWLAQVPEPAPEWTPATTAPTGTDGS